MAALGWALAVPSAFECTKTRTVTRDFLSAALAASCAAVAVARAALVLAKFNALAMWLHKGRGGGGGGGGGHKNETTSKRTSTQQVRESKRSHWSDHTVSRGRVCNRISWKGMPLATWRVYSYGALAGRRRRPRPGRRRRQGRPMCHRAHRWAGSSR